MTSTTTTFRGSATARTLQRTSVRGRLRGAARHVLRLWWAGWQAHVRGILPGDYRK
jgi:hypothetical protein